MARYLIWGVCLGARCAALGRMWAHSIRRIGGWRHDVVVLGDQQARVLEPHGVRVIDIVPTVRQIRPWKHEYAMSLKPLIAFHVDLGRYDYLLYLDMDVLVSNGRLAALVESKQRRAVIAVQRDIIPISANRSFTGRDTLTAQEKAAFADEAICAGIVGVPGGKRGQAFLEDWHAANRAARFAGCDQARLIPLLLRKYRGAWEYMGETVIGRRAERYPETLVHFSARRDEVMKAYYRGALGLAGGRA